MTTMINARPHGRLDQFDWGRNRDGWEFEIHNTTDHDLIFVPEITNNVASCPPRIASGATGFLKGKGRATGGPANCNFAYRHPDHLVNAGGIAIAASADARRARMTASSAGTTQVLHSANPAVNSVQTITYTQR